MKLSNNVSSGDAIQWRPTTSQAVSNQDNDAMVGRSSQQGGRAHNSRR